MVGPLFFRERMIVVNDVFGTICNALFSELGRRTSALDRFCARVVPGGCEVFYITCRSHKAAPDSFFSSVHNGS